MLPALGLWAKLVRPTLKEARLSATNRRITRLAAPSLLDGESASPSQLLALPRIGWLVVCELPKTIRTLGGTDPRFKRSLSSARAAGESSTNAESPIVQRTRRIFIAESPATADRSRRPSQRSSPTGSKWTGLWR